MNYSFDITIPVLNEAATLQKQVAALLVFLREHYPHPAKWRVIIADNGSTDETRAIATQLANHEPEVNWIGVPKRGVGLALKTSWTQSEADIVGYMDLDLATDLQHLPPALEALAGGGADLVYATRLHRDSEVIGRSLKREIASRGFNFLLRAYLGVGFSDGMCGFKFLQRKHLADLMNGGADNDGWFFSTELLTVAEWQGLNLHELPVKWTDDAASSKVKVIPLARKYLASMAVLKKRKPQR